MHDLGFWLPAVFVGRESFIHWMIDHSRSDSLRGKFPKMDMSQWGCSSGNSGHDSFWVCSLEMWFFIRY